MYNLAPEMLDQLTTESSNDEESDGPNTPTDVSHDMSTEYEEPTTPTLSPTSPSPAPNPAPIISDLVPPVATIKEETEAERLKEESAVNNNKEDDDGNQKAQIRYPLLRELSPRSLWLLGVVSLVKWHIARKCSSLYFPVDVLCLVLVIVPRHISVAFCRLTYCYCLMH